MACNPVTSVAAVWVDNNKSIKCTWVDTETNRSGYQVGIEGEPWGAAHPETLESHSVDSGKREFLFAGAGRWFGQVLRCWVKAICIDCSQSTVVESDDLPVNGA